MALLQVVRDDITCSWQWALAVRARKWAAKGMWLLQLLHARRDQMFGRK